MKTGCIFFCVFLVNFEILEKSWICWDRLFVDVGAQPIAGRWMPGTLTNQITTKYLEPRLLIVTDPRTDAQAIVEAAYASIPVLVLPFRKGLGLMWDWKVFHYMLKDMSP